MKREARSVSRFFSSIRNTSQNASQFYYRWCVTDDDYIGDVIRNERRRDVICNKWRRDVIRNKLRDVIHNDVETSSAMENVACRSRWKTSSAIEDVMTSSSLTYVVTSCTICGGQRISINCRTRPEMIFGSAHPRQISLTTSFYNDVTATSWRHQIQEFWRHQLWSLWRYEK